MFVGSVGIWSAEDYIALAVVGDHDVLVVAACFDGVASGVISVEREEWYVRNVELVGEGQLSGPAAWFVDWCLSGWFIRCEDYCKAI
jgi:hypothetical protein